MEYVAIILMGLGAAALGTLWRLEARKRALADRRLRIEQAKPTQKIIVQSVDEAARDDRERRLAEMQMAKLAAEIELLRGQLAAKRNDGERQEAAKEYHELMVEKARLEIDSLRLHIAEARRRLEDWRGEAP